MRGSGQRTLAGLCLAGVLVAGCTVSDDDTGAGDTTAVTGADDGGGRSGGRVAGVTEDTVKLGVASVDPDDIAALGIEGDYVAIEEFYRAWVDAQNERGGVAGRRIELVFEPFLPIGPSQAEAACVALTEDDPVFLVIGIFTDDDSLCITERHATPYIGHFGLSEERQARSRAPFVALEMSDERQRVAGIRAMADAGLLEGRVALYSKSVDSAVVENAVEPALDDLGIDVVIEPTLEDLGDDQAAIDQAVDVIVERIRAADVDVVLNVSDFGDPLLGFQRAGWVPERILSTSAQGLAPTVLEELGLPQSVLEHLTIGTIYNPDVEELRADEQLQGCIEEYNASDPDEPLEMASEDVETLNGIAQSCSAFRLFVAATEDAGRQLTPESWLAGAESLGDLDLPGLPYASLGPGKHSAGDAVALYEYDAGRNAMERTGEPIEVE